MKLARLLPINAVRERRAQRLLHEQQQAREHAVSARDHAGSALEQLQVAHRAALESTLDGGAMSAARAHALLEQAEATRLNMITAHKNLEVKRDEAEKARAAEQEARAHYVRMARSHESMRELSSLEKSRLVKAAQSRSETDADDEFVLSWPSRQKRSAGTS